jgi:heparosan-N-sulfate-glucuronate 5-epimerase
VPYLKSRLPHVGAGSHAIHIAQLRALYSITQNETFKEYAEKWQGM